MPATLKNITERIQSALEYERTVYPDIARDYLKIHPNDYAEYVKHKGHADFQFSYTEGAKTHTVIIRLYPLGKYTEANLAAPYYKRLRQIASEKGLRDIEKTTITLRDIKTLLDDSINTIGCLSKNTPKTLLLHASDYDLYVQATGKTTYQETTLYKHP